MGLILHCIQCGEPNDIIPAREKSFKFCSYACRGKWRAKNWTGANNPRWTGGVRRKTCEHCRKSYTLRPDQPITTFKTQKFCSKKCSDEGGFRYRGEAHYNWTGNPRRRQRPSKQRSWAQAVISRDVATCQHCGAAGVELHAHHVKPHRDFPELRWDVSNGITLCYACHWEVHSACDANGVNSGKPAAGQAGGNPEPSFGRKPVEGVTTRGRAYRRWDGNCNYCGTAVSKRWSDVKGKRHVFCSRSCSAKFQWQNNPPVHGSNASTSSPRESDDIV